MTVLRRSGGYSARLDFNPARVLAPRGIEPCPVWRLGEAVDKVLRALTHRFCVAPQDLPGATVTRLDYAVDFQVGDPVAWLYGLGRFRVKHATERQWHLSRAGVVETYRVGSKNPGHVQVYDKHAKDPGLVPFGYLRWEIQARTDWLRRYGRIKTLADITLGSVERLAQNRWIWMWGGNPNGGPPPAATFPAPIQDVRLDFATGTEQPVMKGHGRAA